MIIGQWFDARALGAKGHPTDDTAAFQRGLQPLSTLWVEPGKYRIGPLVIPPQCRILGAGCDQSILFPRLGEDVQGPLLTDNGNAQKIKIEGIAIYGENRIKGGLIELGFGDHQWGTSAKISGCMFRDCKGYGIRADQNLGLVEDCYFWKVGTALDIRGHGFYLNQCQIVASNNINIMSAGFITNLEIEAPQGSVGVNFRRRTVVKNLFMSLSQSVDYAMEFEQKDGELSGWLFNAKGTAKCKWAKFPGGTIDKPANFTL